MNIKPNDIKVLREKTGAGIMDCKKALLEAGADLAKAEKLIKEWGLAGVEKRSGRATKEGRIFLAEKNSVITALEIGCETDFVARNEDFIKFGNDTAALCLEKGWAEDNAELEAKVREVASVIKENISAKRVVTVKPGAGEILHSYTHGDGRIVVIVTAKADQAAALQNADVQNFIHDIALHIAAFNPMYLDQSKIDNAWIGEQKDIFSKQMEADEKMKGKPANIIEGVLKGKINKAMSEISLMDQGFVKDEKQKVSAVIQGLQKATGSNFTITDYKYIRVGE